jgi:glucose/arabinose dehydrogenase
MLITQDSGQLRVVRDGALLATPAVNLTSRICSGGERGLMGVAVDPNFSSNHYIYLFWTHNAHGYCGQEGPDTPHNRVTRHTLGDNNVVVAGSEKVLVDHIESQQTNHNAGDLNFGADQFLYVSVGDGGCVLNDATRCGALNTNSRRLDIPQGKILRVTRAGGVPVSNPYVGTTGARRCTLPPDLNPVTDPAQRLSPPASGTPFGSLNSPGPTSST